MDRRTAGVVLVLLAIVGVVVIALTPGRRLTGSPTAASFPAAPAAGDCLLDPTDPDNRPAGSRRIPVFGPCSGHTTLGEVVAVRIASGGSVGPVEPRGCRTEALHRAGLQGSTTFRPVGAPAVGPVDWTYSIDVATGWILQVPELPTASTWAACVATPADGRLGAGTLAGAFAGGSLPGDYGTCWQSSDVDTAMRMVNCNLPHVSELIAFGSVPDGTAVSSDTVTSSCAAQARRVLRRDDPAAGGLLQVAVRPNDAVPADRPSDLTCYLTATGGHRIIGSLIGLGDAPVRYVG